MKQIFVLMVLVTTFSFNTMAGTLYNKATNETVEFTLDQLTGELSMSSSAGSVANKTIILKKVEAEKSSINLFEISDGYSDTFCKSDDYRNECLVITWVIPPLSLLRVGTTLIDALAMPVKAPLKYFQNKRNQRDYQSLMVAVNSNEIVEVTDAKFKRIVKLLN